MKDDIVEVGVIPAGKSNIKIQLTADMDIDIQLYDGSTKLVAWSADGSHGMLSGAAKQVLDYQGIKVVWSGYNGTRRQQRQRVYPHHRYRTERLHHEGLRLRGWRRNCGLRMGCRPSELN